MLSHDNLKKEAKAAIDALYADMTVSISVTRDDLAELRDDINVMIDACETMLHQKGGE